MNTRKLFFGLLVLTLMAALAASLFPQTTALAVCGRAGSPPCPPPPTSTSSSNGSGAKKSHPPLILPTPTSTIVAMIETWAAETQTAAPTLTPTGQSCVVCPPTVMPPPTKVAGPVFLLPGVINTIIIVALVAILASALILVIRR